MAIADARSRPVMVEPLRRRVVTAQELLTPAPRLARTSLTAELLADAVEDDDVVCSFPRGLRPSVP
jgi:hypothetical protein